MVLRQELRKREDGREGCFGQVDEGFKGTQEGGPDLWADDCRDGKKHSSEAFYAMDDPLEAAIFSVLVEIIKRRETP